MCQSCLNTANDHYATLALLSNAADNNRPVVDISGWKVTFAYYVACTFVRTLAHQRLSDPRNHQLTKAWMRSQNDVGVITTAYSSLEGRSWESRYKGRKFILREMQEAVIWYDEVMNCLVPLIRASGIGSVTKPDVARWLLPNSI